MKGMFRCGVAQGVVKVDGAAGAVNYGYNVDCIMFMSDDDKKAALEAGKQGVKDAYEKTNGKGMRWWERLVWVILAGLCAAGSCLFSGCGAMGGVSWSSEQGQLFVSRAADGSMVVSTVPPVVQQRLVK